MKAGRRRTRVAIRPIASMSLTAPPGTEADDTRTERAVEEVVDRVNELIEKVQDNIDLGTLT